MNQPIPVPPQHMPGGQRMMPQGQQGQQRPPPQFPHQGQFPPPQFQQPPQVHQRLPIVTDDRFNADQPINGVARIHNIVPIKPKTEKDYRKELTTYAAYTISPSKDDTVKDRKDKDNRSSSTKTVDKGTWTRALIIEQFFAQDDITKTVKKLDERESVTKKMKDLGPNQSTQVSNILDSKLMSDRDPQFEWVVAQLDKAFNVDKHGKKTTKSITVYLRRAPKADVDCMEMLRRREQRKFEQQQQQQQQQQQHLEHQRNVQAMQRQQEMQQIQHQMPQMGRGMGPGPMGPGRMGPPPMAGRGRGGGGGPPAGIRVVQSDSSSDSSSNSGSDSESDSEVSSATSHSISTRPSRSGRHGRRDKQYYGRGTSRTRSRSRNRNSREKDYLVVEPPRRRLESGRATPGRGVHYVPDSPRSPRGSSRPGFPRSSTYNGRPSVRVQTSRESQEDFFSMDQHSPRMQPRPILHQTRPDATNIDMLAAAMQAGVQAGIRASKEESVATQALTVQRPVTLHRDPLTMPRPPMPHSVSDFQDRRPRGRDLDDIVARAEALQLQDDLARYRDHRDQALRDSRSPPRGLPRDLDRVPRRFAGADMFDPYRSTPMSPSISSGSSGFSHSSRGGRDPYSSRDHEYEHRRRAPSVFDSDREEYDFVGRDEANPFRPLHYRRASSRSRPPPLRRDSFRSEIPFSRGGY